MSHRKTETIRIAADLKESLKKRRDEFNKKERLSLTLSQYAERVIRRGLEAESSPK